MGIFDSIKLSEVERNMPLGILRSIANVRIKMNCISTFSVLKFDLQLRILSILKMLKSKYGRYIFPVNNKSILLHHFYNVLGS